VSSGDQVGQLDDLLACDGTGRERARERSRGVPGLVVPEIAHDQVYPLDARDLGSSEDTERKRLPGPSHSEGTYGSGAIVAATITSAPRQASSAFATGTTRSERVRNASVRS
jgi:hypothetical protein